MTRNDYNRIAPFYDTLADFVIGKQLLESQAAFLDRIKTHSKVLIIGGGTGRILELLDALDVPMHVHFLDASEKMIGIAKSKPLTNISPEFHCGRLDQLETGYKFDVVITNYFLDMFEEPELSKLVRTIRSSISVDGRWICTDFQRDGNLFQRALVAMMYSFFSVATNITSKRLPDFQTLFEHNDLDMLESRSYKLGFIRSFLLRRRESVVSTQDLKLDTTV